MKLLMIPRPESHTPADLESPDVLLDRALDLALAKNPMRVPAPRKTTRRAVTRRAGLLLGKKCNLRCHFCSYLDRIDNPAHPEYAFLPLEKAKAICKTLVDVFGRSAINFEGGEPSIYPQILPLLEYCNEIGLFPTLVTNAIVLDRKERVEQFQRAGIRDFAISIHGLGAVHDAVVGMEGAHVRQMNALRNMAELGVPFRINTVMTKATLLHLPQIATLAVRTGARAINFNTFSPWDDQVTAGTRTAQNVPSYSEARDQLEQALDIVAAADIEVNVKYFPLCMVPERHRKSAYNFAQLQYDHHEWDHASFAWVDDLSQRLATGDIVPPTGEFLPPLRRPVLLRIGRLRGTVQKLSSRSARLGRWLEQGEERLVAALKNLGLHRVVEESVAEEKQFCMDYAVAARSVCYQYGRVCQACDAKTICDGLHSDYESLFGQEEIRPIQLGFKVADPTFYVREQAKVVEREDESWAL